MIRLMSIAAILALSSCTLLLPTEEIIQPCTVDEDCAEGFECEDQACLPVDENDDTGDGEGEGEGE
jgi:hypothetical protein